MWRGRAVLSVLGPSVLPSSGNNYQVTTAHTWQPCLPRYKPTPTTLTMRMNNAPSVQPLQRQVPGWSHCIAACTIQTALATALARPATVPGICCSAPSLYCLGAAGIHGTAGNGSLVPEKSLPIVRIRSTPGCRPSPSKITGTECGAVSSPEHPPMRTVSANYTHSGPVQNPGLRITGA